MFGAVSSKKRYLPTAPCIIPAFLDYNMLVVNFKGMEEELFLCEGGGEIDWDMGSFMWDAEGGAGAPFPLGWVMYRI